MTNTKHYADTDTSQMVTLERRGNGIALLTLNRPPLNLFTLEMTRVFGQRLNEIKEDSSIRSVVLTGAGERAFGAGSDIKEFPDYFETGTVTQSCGTKTTYTTASRICRKPPWRRCEVSRSVAAWNWRCAAISGSAPKI